jgi:hypothetical protein
LIYSEFGDTGPSTALRFAQDDRRNIGLSPFSVILSVVEQMRNEVEESAFPIKETPARIFAPGCVT